jgi:hypothetical protein
MQGWAGRFPSSRRSPQLSPGKHPPISKPSEMGESLNLLRDSRHVSQFSGLILGLSLYSYHVRELLVCWLFFTLLFVCLALLLLGGVLAVYAGERVTGWARTPAGMTPVLALAPAELRVKIIPIARKLK